jgi:predicted AlkP superfamily phosphohydrolase/phosphomutase
MNRRIAVYIVIGAALAAALFYWLYIKPLRSQVSNVLSASDPAVKKSIETTRDKVLVIGVDGMSWDVALPLIAQGKMPNLARLLARGAHGLMKGEGPLISPAIWTTVATGMPREAHGIDDFFAKVPFEYRQAVMSTRFRRVPALWQMADWAGKSVGAVNWYAAMPAEKINRGVFIAQGITDPRQARPDQVYPEAWLERVRSVPLPKSLPYEDLLARVNDPRVQNAYDQDRAMFAVSLEIMREQHPDLMLVYFQNVDVISHGFWKYRAPIGLDYSFPVSAADKVRYQDVIDLHYQLTDRMIGGLLAEAEGYTVFVLSDHGFGPTYPPHNIFPDLNQLLERMDRLNYRNPSCDAILASIAAKGYLDVRVPHADNIFTLCQTLRAEAARAGGEIDPAQVDAFLSANFNLKAPEADAEQERWQQTMTDLAGAIAPRRERGEISWAKTSAWNPSDFHRRVQGIYLNLKDRDPEGVVPRDDMKKYRSRLIRDLAALRTDGGRHFFTRVEANPAKSVMPTTVADLPDVLVEVNRDALVDNLAFRGPYDLDPIPIAALRWSYQDVNGDHQPGGVFIVSGENSQTFKRLDADDLDLTPTILWLLGLPVGADMKGWVLTSAFEEKLQSRQPLRIASWADLIKPGAPAPLVTISPELNNLMKGIGYLQPGPPTPPPPAPQPGDTSAPAPGATTP